MITFASIMMMMMMMMPPPLLLALLLLVVLFANTAVAAISIEYVAGQRCLLTPSASSSASVAGTTSAPNPNPPLVLLGGMAQSIASWEHHLPALSKQRDVLLYEARGQGPPRMNVPLEDQFNDVSLSAQADYLMTTIHELFTTNDDNEVVVDLVGFSLGGRIAMATCIKYPQLVRKLHLTGVGADRSLLGHLTVSSWKDHVACGDNNLRSFAWSVLLATYSPQHLVGWQQQGKLETILNFVATQNSQPGLTALLEQAHPTATKGGGDDGDDPWSTIEMAKKIVASSTLKKGRACVGSLDNDMAPVSEVQKLCDILGWEKPTVLDGCGHAVPMEQPRLWRNDVLEFLNE